MNKKKIGYILEYWGLRFFVMIIRLLSRRTALAIGGFIGYMIYILGIRKQVSMVNLKRVFGETKSKKELENILRKNYIHLGKMIIEACMYPYLQQWHKRGWIKIQGKEFLDEALKRGRGVIMITGHFGNWEMGGMYLSLLDFNLLVPYHPLHNPYVDDWLNNERKKYGVKLAPMKEATKPILKALRQNEIVALIADQDAGADGLFVDFLGTPASTFRGAGTLIRKTGAAMLFGVAIRDEHNNIIVCLEKPYYHTKSENIEEDLINITITHIKMLEDYIRKYPELYFWQHRRWKTKPDGTRREKYE